jgi:hypothetical protein
MNTSLPFRVWTVLAALLLAVVIVASLHPPEANAQATLPSGFHEKVVFSGLSEPTNVEFSNTWSDSGAQSHDIVAPDAAATYTATYHSSGG